MNVDYIQISLVEVWVLSNVRGSSNNFRRNYAKMLPNIGCFLSMIENISRLLK